MDRLADQSHIDRIRSKLWSGRAFGEAAVMVGAGLSLNAKAISSSASRFPTWRDLTTRLYKELHPGGNEDRDALAQARTTSGALQLAEEYETAFSRNGLDEFLLKELPDTSFEGSHLHKLLLELPWSDVFTTNVDTLLERSSPGIVDRNYKVLRTMSEIPGSIRPRIVKLHGSFPATKPFIFTQEDFRTYPKKFSPFVNLVQQSMMENEFCLLGFSGDDPNFLNWAGWVRDNLGESAPRIYLCGLLELTSTQRDVLQRRNIICIDLSPMFPRSQYPDNSARHALALEWFLRNLQEGRPPSKTNWPHPDFRKVETPSKGLPSWPESYHPQFAKEPETNRASEMSTESLQELINSWRHNRTHYPGWLIAPSKCRDTLWDHTKHAISAIVNKATELNSSQQTGKCRGA